MGLKEYTGEAAEVFGKRPVKVFIEQEDGPPKNWEWGEFRKRLIDICNIAVREVVTETIDATIDAAFECFKIQTSPKEAVKIAFDEVRRRRGGRLLRPLSEILTI